MATTDLLKKPETAWPAAPSLAERLPKTSLAHYLTGKTALNIPAPEGTGDWHFVETFEGYGGRPPGNFTVAGVGLLDTRSWLGDQGVFDARERLAARGLDLPPRPVWAADHYRAVADLVLNALARGWDFERLISLDDWLCRPEEQARLAALLEQARPGLSDEGWRRVQQWLIDSAS